MLNDTYGDLEVDKLFGKGAHLVVEAERVGAGLLRGENKVSLPLLLARENNLAVRALNLVIDIERAARLHLSIISVHLPSLNELSPRSEPTAK